MNEKTIILIPARYASSRFPGKPLAELNGVPMIRRVYERCKHSGLETCVLTDDMRIANQVSQENVYYDTRHYSNGTERCAGAIQSNRFDNYEHIINVQGDMPDVTVDMINHTSDLLQKHSLATLFSELSHQEKNNPNTVKMINTNALADGSHKALWFGRGFSGYGSHHLGIYGYNRKILKKYLDMKPPPEETQENLEQIRWLKHGIDIHAKNVIFSGIEINSPEDLESWHKKN